MPRRVRLAILGQRYSLRACKHNTENSNDNSTTAHRVVLARVLRALLAHRCPARLEAASAILAFCCEVQPDDKVEVEFNGAEFVANFVWYPDLNSSAE